MKSTASDRVMPPAKTGPTKPSCERDDGKLANRGDAPLVAARHPLIHPDDQRETATRRPGSITSRRFELRSTAGCS